MNRKKIFLLCPMLHQGGFERVVVSSARALEKDYDVTIVIFDDKDIAYDVSGLNIINLNLGVKRKRIQKAINVVSRIRALKKLKKTIKPDVCYSYGSTANVVNCLAKVSGVRDWVGMRSYADILNKRKLRLYMHKADLIVCCAKAIEDELNTKYHYTKTATLYNLYDLDRIRLESEGDPELPWGEKVDGKPVKMLITLGRDDEQKCYWHMIKVFKLVHDKVPEARLAILGVGDFKDDKKLAYDLGLGDNVFFAGLKKDPYKYLKKADIYIHTSSVEGFPNALVEGMAFGLATVATDCKTGPREILDGDEKSIYAKYGLLFPVMNRERSFDTTDFSEEKPMADEIIRLLSDEDFLKDYQEKALERAADFSYEAYCAEFSRLAN